MSKIFKIIFLVISFILLIKIENGFSETLHLELIPLVEENYEIQVVYEYVFEQEYDYCDPYNPYYDPYLCDYYGYGYYDVY